MKIAYFARDRGACSYYRVILPNETLKRKKLADVYCIEKGDNTDHISKAITDADLVIIPRVSDDYFVEFIKGLKNEGITVATEYDDYLFDISPLSPHYTDYGEKEVEVEISGTKVKLWEDGKNIDLKATAKRRDNVKRALELSDFTIVTTDLLADSYREYTDQFSVLPNCVDTAIWQPLPLKKNGEVRLYWSGGASHYEDLCVIAEALTIISKKYPQVKFVVMGQMFNGPFSEIPKNKVECHPWTPVEAYPYKTAILNADIALVPLKDTAFNRCKSSIKWVEQAALGIPAVMSMVSPYREMFNGQNAVMVADNTTDQWVKGISMLIDDPILRAKIGGEAGKYVKQNYDINIQCFQWLNAYKKHVGC